MYWKKANGFTNGRCTVPRGFPFGSSRSNSRYVTKGPHSLAISAKSLSLALLMLSLDVAFGKPDLFTSCKISARALVLTNLRRPKLARFIDLHFALCWENGEGLKKYCQHAGNVVRKFRKTNRKHQTSKTWISTKGTAATNVTSLNPWNWQITRPTLALFWQQMVVESRATPAHPTSS